MAGRDDTGSGSVELIASVPWIFLFIAAALQLFFAAYGANVASNAARSVARIEGRGCDGGQQAQRAVPSWLRPDGFGWYDTNRSGDSVRATIRVDVPLLLPGMGPVQLRRTATMPVTSQGGVGCL
jgi:hypothetical protein